MQVPVGPEEWDDGAAVTAAVDAVTPTGLRLDVDGEPTAPEPLVRFRRSRALTALLGGGLAVWGLVTLLFLSFPLTPTLVDAETAGPAADLGCGRSTSVGVWASGAAGAAASEPGRAGSQLRDGCQASAQEDVVAGALGVGSAAALALVVVRTRRRWGEWSSVPFLLVTCPD